MLIQVTSTLTAEDENTQAPALLRALSEILNSLPIAYAIRIDTADAHVYAQSRASDRGAITSERPRASILEIVRPLRN